MCLGVPGRIESIDRSQPLLMGRVSFGGVEREVCLEHVSDACVGEYVIVHVGFALSKLDEAAAMRVFELLDELNAAEALAREADDEVR